MKHLINLQICYFTFAGIVKNTHLATAKEEGLVASDGTVSVFGKDDQNSFYLRCKYSRVRGASLVGLQFPFI